MPKAIEELACNKIKLTRAPQLCRLCRWTRVREKLCQIYENMNSIGKKKFVTAEVGICTEVYIGSQRFGENL